MDGEYIQLQEVRSRTIAPQLSPQRRREHNATIIAHEALVSRELDKARGMMRTRKHRVLEVNASEYVTSVMFSTWQKSRFP